MSIEPLWEDLGTIDLTSIDWVIVGGESGPGARPMAAEWVRSIRDQCQQTLVPFFFKQWGGTRKKLAGGVLDGRTYDAIPEIKTYSPPAADLRRILIEDVRRRVAAMDLAFVAK